MHRFAVAVPGAVPVRIVQREIESGVRANLIPQMPTEKSIHSFSAGRTARFTIGGYACDTIPS